MRAMPNMHVLSPSDSTTAAALFNLCLENIGPKYLRFDAQIFPAIYSEAPEISKGFHVHKKGDRICLIATGYMLQTAQKVANELMSNGINVGVIDLFDLSHFSADSLQTELEQYSGLVSLEEGFRGRGGMDAMLFEFIARRNIPAKLLNIGVEGEYRFELGTRAELHEQVGIGPHAVLKSVSRFASALI